jgi:hypothetical protein
MKYESLSKFLVKLNQWFVNWLYPLVLLKSGHKLCLMIIIQKTKNSNTP